MATWPERWPYIMHSFGAGKGDFNCVGVSRCLRSNLACFPYLFRCSLDGQCWPETELRDKKSWESCMQTLVTDLAAQEGLGGNDNSYSALSHHSDWR